MKMKRLALVMAVSILAAALTGCTGLKDSDVVATINGDDVTAAVANFYTRYQQAQYETSYGSYMGDDMWSTEVSEGETYEESTKKNILESIKTMYVLEDHMKDYDVSITDEEKEKIAKAAKSFDEDNALEEKKAVSASDKKTVERVLTLYTVQKKMFDAMTADVDTKVSDDEAVQKSMQYVQFPFTKQDDSGTSADLTDEEKAELKKTAQKFAEGAKDIKDFEAYAKKEKQEAKTITFDSKSTTVDATLLKEADKLKKGEVTGLVETDNGYFVAKVTSLLDRKATDEKKESIVQERKNEKYEELCKKWLKKADTKVNKGLWKKIDFKKQGVTVKEVDKTPYTDKNKTK